MCPRHVRPWSPSTPPLVPLRSARTIGPTRERWRRHHPHGPLTWRSCSVRDHGALPHGPPRGVLFSTTTKYNIHRPSSSALPTYHPDHNGCFSRGKSHRTHRAKTLGRADAKSRRAKAANGHRRRDRYGPGLAASPHCAGRSGSSTAGRPSMGGHPGTIRQNPWSYHARDGRTKPSAFLNRADTSTEHGG